LKPVISPGAFRTLILRFSASTVANGWGAVRISLVPGMAPGSRAEIWQRDHGTTTMAMRCETLLRYMLRAFDNVDTDVLGREVLFESELALVGGIRCHNTDEFFVLNDLCQ
jgi:hypothetical protein